MTTATIPQETEIMPTNPETMALVRADSAAMSAGEIRAQVNRVQEVMQEVMQEGTHFGVVPGTQKPSLWKPGAEKLGLTFHLAIDSTIDADLSTDDMVRYRVRSVVTSQASGAFLGSALGECSSNEEKYKWRAAVCKAEWEETGVDRRRKKWKRDGTAIEQVRTEPADLANTILKMAVKRAEVAAILKVTAASDCFTQDIEDLPEEMRQEAVNEEKPKNGNGKPAPPPAQPTQAPPANVISEAQAKRFYAIRKGKGWSDQQVAALLKDHGIADDRQIPRKFYDGLCSIVEHHTFDEYQALKNA